MTLPNYSEKYVEVRDCPKYSDRVEVWYADELLFYATKGGDIPSFVRVFNSGLARGFREGRLSLKHQLQELLDISPKEHNHIE